MEFDEHEDIAIIPPNGGWGWLVVFCAFYCNIIIDGIQLTFGTFLGAIANDFEVAHSEVSLVGSLMFGVHLLVGSVCSGCTAIFGLRPVTIVGCIICTFGVGLSYFATNIYILYFTYGILGGIGIGLVYMNTLMITSLYFTTFLPVAIGVVVCGSGVGTMIFAALGYVFLRMTTWKITFLIQAGLLASMLLAVATFKPLKPVKVKIVPPGGLPKGAYPGQPQEESPRASIFIKDFERHSEQRNKDEVIQGLWSKYLEDQLVSEITAENRNPKCCECPKWCKKSKCLKKKKENVIVLSPVISKERKLSYVTQLGASEVEETAPNVEYFKKIDLEEKKPKTRFFSLIKKTIIEVLDYHLLKSPAFTMLTLTGAVQLSTNLIVYIFEKDRCTALGFSEEMTMYFLISLGGSNTFWRLFFGTIALLPKATQIASVSGIVLGGVAVIFSGFHDSPYYQFGFCFFFGLGMGSFAVFRVVLIGELMGWENLHNATGINLVFMGIFSIIFPPVLGYLTEISKNYDVIFCTSGGLLVLSGLLQIPVPKMRERELKKNNSRPQ